MVRNYIINGWPSKRSDVDESARRFFNFREELSLEDDIILKGEQIVVPSSKHKEILKIIHSSHIGI